MSGINHIVGKVAEPESRQGQRPLRGREEKLERRGWPTFSVNDQIGLLGFAGASVTTNELCPRREKASIDSM